MELRIENLTKKFGSYIAVNNVSFNVSGGQIFGIIGPNGAGKTTILKIIEGLLKQDYGKVLFNGQEITHKEKVRKIGVQLQDNTLLEYATVQETIDFFADLYQCMGSENKNLINAFQVEEILKKRVKDLSIGQQRNLCILLAFIHNPELVILDEPSSGLDPKARGILWDYIKEYVRNNNNIVIVTTHLMEEVENLCNSIVFINKGSIVMAGNPKEIMARTSTKMKIHIEFSTNEKRDIEKSLEMVAYNLHLSEKEIFCETQNVHGFLVWLTEYLSKTNIEITHLEIRHSNLEEIYLHEVNKNEDF